MLEITPDLDEKVVNYLVGFKDGQILRNIRTFLQLETSDTRQLMDYLKLLEIEGKIHGRWLNSHGGKMYFSGPAETKSLELKIAEISHNNLSDKKILEAIKNYVGEFESIASFGRIRRYLKLDKSDIPDLKSRLHELEENRQIYSLGKGKHRIYYLGSLELPVNPERKQIDSAMKDIKTPKFSVGFIETLKHPIQSQIDKGKKDPITLEEMAWAICSVFDAKGDPQSEKDAFRTAYEVMSLFSYGLYQSDTIFLFSKIDKKTRTLLYNLETEGILKMVPEEENLEGKDEDLIRNIMRSKGISPVFTSVGFRIPWWVIKETETRLLAKKYCQKYHSEVKAIEATETLVYDELAEDAWMRD